MSAGIKWGAPPPSAKRSGAPVNKHAAFADALKSRPGEWAQLPGEWSIGMTTVINSGRASDWRPQGAFEATGRRVGVNAKRVHIWVRYIGGAA